MSSRRRDVRTPRAVTESVALDRETVEALARRVVELLRSEDKDSGLIDAAEVARRLGVARSTVYDKAEQLGAMRLGTGPRARLRFDPRVVEMLVTSNEPAPARQADTRLKHRRRSPRRTPGRRELLPIHRGSGRRADSEVYGE